VTRESNGVATEKVKGFCKGGNEMAGRLVGRVAIVTGAGEGLGRASSLSLAEEGARVVTADINPTGAEDTARRIQEAGSEAVAVRADVSDLDQTRAMAKAALDAYGRIDILVNNAGIYPVTPWDEITLEEWNRVLAVNLTGTFLCARAVFPAMKSQGYGKIINISSDTFFSGVAGMLHYVTTKGGVIGFTRTLAREVGIHGIRVNAIAPGITQTEGMKALVADGKYPAAAAENAVAQRCISRHESVEDLVGAVIFLASPESDFITGQTINVDGGRFMH
jgi:NAD(P)-dependent dehydrogenase (short-subunit alcohol dehydrogenase family)